MTDTAFGLQKKGSRISGSHLPPRPPQPQYLEPVDRGIGATPAARPSYADILERAKVEARNRLRVQMSDEGAEEDGYRDACVIAHDIGRLRDPAAYRYGFFDAAGNDFFFGGDRDAIKKAGRDVFAGRAKNFDEAYELHRRLGRERRQSFDYRHPLQSFIADMGLSVATLPIGPLGIAGGMLKGGIVGAIQGADEGETTKDRFWNGVRGAAKGAASGGLFGSRGYFLRKLDRLARNG